jgi:hypothetical protein
MTTEELVETLVSEWGEREVYPLEKNEFDVLSLSPNSHVSEYDNGDGTVTTTVLYQGKTFIYNEVRP